MSKNLSFMSYIVVGTMLFALFFGAGNLIFPASLGQLAGTNLWYGIGGFLITGIGLPFLGILAMGFSGSNNLQQLASRVHPVYAVIFTSLVYLTIGPFFAAPRTGAVAYDIGISPFIGQANETIGLFIFTILFFGLTLYLSLNPLKLVDRIGKILSPLIVILLIALLAFVIMKPMGAVGEPIGNYMTESSAFFTGFKEGYNTMDALASLVFGIIVITSIRQLGVTSRRGILAASFKTGLVATILLGVIYVGIAYLGATSTSVLGIFENGGPVLSGTSAYYFGNIGLILLAIVIILACLTTSVGLVTACGEYFNQLIPKISYKSFVIFFSTFCFIIANFGLANIINYSIPVLMFLYPLAIVLMLSTFVSPLFNHSRIVYIIITIVTLCISTIDGISTFYRQFERTYPNWLTNMINLYDQYLPLYSDGLGWLIPFLVIVIFIGIIPNLFMKKASK